MSLIFQNISAGAPAGAKTAGTSGGAANASAGTALVPAFGVSLTQLMTSTAGGSQEASAMNGVASLLEGLLKNAQATAVQGNGDSDEQNTAALLQSLLLDADQLDEAIAEDPEVLSALQSWIQQVTTLLLNVQGNGEAQSEDIPANEGDQALTALASHPATARFAAQDALAQLITVLQQPNTGADTTAQAAELLETFHNLVQNATAPGKNKPAALVKDLESAAPQDTAPMFQPKAEGQASRISALLEAIRQQPAGDTASAASGKAVLSTILTRQLPNADAQTAASAASPSSGEEMEAAAKPEDPLASQTTVTAGHLVMKEGIQSPHKAAAPAVPVTQFAKEMSTFVVNKLEIVKQEGISEAKISLYPEHLGQVDIKLTMQNGQLVAQFTTEHAGAKDLLEQQMSQLRSTLQSQGVQVEKLVVTQNPSLQSQMYHDGRQSQSGQQQPNRRQKDKDTSSEDALTVAELGDELNEWLARQQADQGNTFTAKA
ncbi:MULTISPECIES: flagellar hook-length control protein FliK [Paenibacillus]|uniref:flagellar hook-length control protein FliK n=1 Tax=Paenibacillus TaxID=44249 RepID=UPI0011A97856|nr:MULTISPECIES: flagellar hook-length control protein FliK [Paenibacillus]MBJ9990215.1 flagellar hook-length control protein FliK [Paenibacillus sp. S28]